MSDKPSKIQKPQLFGISEDFSSPYQSLDEIFIKRKASTFFFEVDTDCMVPTLIKGDFLLVDRSLEYFDQRVCVLTYEGGLVCKRVF